MKNNNVKYQGFTLVEIIIAMTIFSMIMVSVFSVFWVIVNLNNKLDISRAMQENIKNLTDIIAQDMRLNEIWWVNANIVADSCSMPSDENMFKMWDKLCIWENSYYLAKNVDGSWVRVWSRDECVNNQCYIVQNNWSKVTQLTNSWVEFEELSFWVSNPWEEKITINFILKPARWKGIRDELIYENKMIFQTTLSKRLYGDY